MVLWLPFRSVGKKGVGGRQTNGTFKQNNCSFGENYFRPSGFAPALISYFLSSRSFHPKKASNPPIPNQRVGIATQHTIHRPHSPHSAQHLLLLLPKYFHHFIPNERFFVCFKVGPCRNGIRHQKTF